MKVVVLGPYPKPYGGISVHIKRLKERLEENNIACTVYDDSGISKKEDGVVAMGSLKRWVVTRFFYKEDSVIHYHSFGFKSLILLSILSILKGERIIITLHSFRYNLGNTGLLCKFAIWLAGKTNINFIAVNPEIKKKIVSLGIKCENVEIIPAFIPPTVRKEEIAEIPHEVWDFIDSHSPVISGNAFKISFYNSQDLYGIDMCIDLSAALKKDYPQIGFVFCLPAIGDCEYFNKMKQKIKEKRLEDNFLFQTKPCQMYPIIMKSDVFVRPTNTDGDTVSLREALHFRVPSVASDVVPRPEGTVLFKSRDVDDFSLKVKNMLDDCEEYKARLNKIKLKDNFEKILKVYQKLGQIVKRLEVSI